MVAQAYCEQSAVLRFQAAVRQRPSETTSPIFSNGLGGLYCDNAKPVLTGYIGDEAQAGQAMYFRVVQECEKGINRWIEIPAGEGAPTAEPAEPAAALKLLPKR